MHHHFLLDLENIIVVAETVVPECIQDPLSSISLSDFQGNMMDSTSKPIVEGENVTKSDNLGDVQLREVMMSPNKLETDKKTRQARDNSDVSYVTIGSCTVGKPYFEENS